MQLPVLHRELIMLALLQGFFSSAFAVEATVVAPLALNPVITKVSPAGCLKSGDGFQVAGNNFGSSQARSLVLKTQSGMVTVPVSVWAEKSNSISAKLPTSSDLLFGKSYPVLIINKSDQRIISNRDKLVTVCALQANIVTKQETQTATLKMPVTEEEPLLDSGEQSSPDSPRLAPSGGSLIGGLPQPTFIPEIKEEKNDSYEEKELIIISLDMENALRLADQVAQEGYRIKRRRILQSLGFIINVVALPEDAKVSEVLKQFQQRDSNLLVDANHRYSLQASRDEHNPQIHQSIKWGKTSEYCGKDIKIGILDSLVDTSYPGFGEKKIINKSLLPLGVKPADKEHATAIASIIAGQTDSAIMGLLPASSLYVAGVFRNSKDDRIDTTAELIINGLDWLQSQGVHAINLSMAGPRNLLLEVSIRRLLDQNALIAASVGNDGLENAPIYPAAIDGVVGVTAVDSRERIYQRANRGKFVLVAAPGVDIWAARGSRPPAYLSGTSFATPYVTASLAVLRQKHLDWPSIKIISQLIEKTKDLGEKGKDITFGAGLLQFKGCQ